MHGQAQDLLQDFPQAFDPLLRCGCGRRAQDLHQEPRAHNGEGLFGGWMRGGRSGRCGRWLFGQWSCGRWLRGWHSCRGPQGRQGRRKGLQGLRVRRQERRRGRRRGRQRGGGRVHRQVPEGRPLQPRDLRQRHRQHAHGGPRDQRQEDGRHSGHLPATQALAARRKRQRVREAPVPRAGLWPVRRAREGQTQHVRRH